MKLAARTDVYDTACPGRLLPGLQCLPDVSCWGRELPHRTSVFGWIFGVKFSPKTVHQFFFKLRPWKMLQSSQEFSLRISSSSFFGTQIWNLGLVDCLAPGIGSGDCTESEDTLACILTHLFIDELEKAGFEHRVMRKARRITGTE